MKNKSHIRRDDVRSLQTRAQFRLGTFKDMKFNEKVLSEHSKKALGLKQFSGFKSKFSDRLKWSGFNPSTLHPDLALNQYVKEAKIPVNQRQSSGGSSLEPCNTSDDCIGARSCAFQNEDGDLSLCSGQSDCFCLPNEPDQFFCSCDEIDCFAGDICTTLESGTTGCVSDALGLPGINCPVDSSTEFSFETCTTSEDCIGSRSCTFVSDDGDLSLCSGQSDCICLANDIDEILCSCDDLSCLTGDICTTLTSGTNVCASLTLDLARIDCPDGGSSSTEFSLETCSTSDECVGARFCAFVSEDGDVSLCSGQSDCICLPNDPDSLFCSCEERGCLSGDICTTLDSGTSLCASLTFDPVPIDCPSNDST